MRTLSLLSAILVTLATQTCALEQPHLHSHDVARPRLNKRADIQVTPLQKEELKNEDKSTTFNGVRIPAMTELGADSFNETTKNGYWFVKFHSPYCPSCRRIAPHFQTIYEFYSASKPTGSSKPQDSPNQFENYYNFHFASMDCVSNDDKCKELNIIYWPTISLYKNSQLVETAVGETTISALSQFVEKHLNNIHPGSRPGEIKLPNVGARGAESPDFKFTSPAEDYSNDRPHSVPLAGEKEHVDHKGAHNSPDQSRPVSHDTITKTTDSTKVQSHATVSATSSHAATATPTAPSFNIHSSQGASLPLTAESFQKLVTDTEDTWFIRFYSDRSVPSRNLRPIWHHVAKAMKDKIKIGDVNCDTETALCKDARVRRYPTLIFFRGGHRVRYDGIRGYGDLMKVANRAAEIDAFPVKHVNASSFRQLEKKEDVIFLYFYDHAATSEDFEALNKTRLDLAAHAPIFRTNDTELVKRFEIPFFPRFMCYREGQTNFYSQSDPQPMRDHESLVKWMKSVWLPLVSELNPTNARDILHQKYAVLGILNRQRPAHFKSAKRELKNAALEWHEKQSKLFQMERQDLRDSKQLRIEEAKDRNNQRQLRAAKSIRIQISEEDRKQARFAWVDGLFWQRWLKTSFGIDGRNGERVIINDEANHRYWDTTTSGASITASRTSILETLTNIVSSPYNLNSRPISGGIQRFHRLRVFILFHPVLSSFITVASCASAAWYLRLKVRRWRPSWTRNKPQTMATTGPLDGKDGATVLPLTETSNGAGKVD